MTEKSELLKSLEEQIDSELLGFEENTRMYVTADLEHGVIIIQPKGRRCHQCRMYSDKTVVVGSDVCEIELCPDCAEANIKNVLKKANLESKVNVAADVR